jgi:hypothetical protein
MIAQPAARAVATMRARVTHMRNRAATACAIAAIAIGTPLLLTSCEEYPADVESVEPPSITSLRVEPDSLNITTGAASFDVVTGTRSGAAVDSVHVHVQSPDRDETRSCASRAPDGGTRTDGTWRCSLTLEPGAATGSWIVSGLAVFPARADVLRADDADLAAAGYARIVRAVIETRPTATINLPALGSRFVRGDTIRFVGSGADGAGRPLGDAALSWASSIDGTLGTGGTLSRADLSAGEHRITLTATDPNGLAAQDSTRITVLAHVPVAAVVVTPPFAELAAIGDTVRFRAAAFAVDGVEVGNVAFAWSSSDTAVAAVNAQGLATVRGYGRADITAAVDAVTGGALLVVTEPDPPAAVIAAPADGATFEAGAAITFSGSATDARGVALTGAALAWTSSRDGALGTGTSITRNDLSAGAHTITLTATDAEGRTGTAGIGITVRTPGPAQWVAVGDGGSAIITSEDGLAWTARAAPLGRGRAVARSHDMWVVTGDMTAVDGSTTLVTSSDGLTWTARPTPFDNTGLTVAWNGEYWLAGAAARSGSSTLARSTDGLSWTTPGVTPFTIATLGLAWNGRTWVAVGAGGRGTGTTIARSTDGVNWTASDSPFGTSTTIDNAGIAVAWNGSLWVAVGQGATALATSADGISWTPRSTPFTTGRAIAWNGSLWVAAGAGSATIITSADGITWTARSAPFTTAHGVAWDGQQWVATGAGSASLATSPDGITWTARAVPLTSAWGVASAQPIVAPPLPDPPVVTITAPLDGATIDQGSAVTFSGSAIDGLGVPLGGSSLAWTSSRDGQLGSGTSFTRSDLTVGTHTITLTATDARGVSADASVTVTVEPRTTGPAAGIIAYSPGTRIRTLRVEAAEPTLWDRIGSAPRWSPGGEYVAFLVNSRLWVMDADGSNARRLTEYQTGFLSWSPDGREIAIQSSVDGVSWSILSVDPFTGDSIRRITGTADADQYPEWSPAGDRIAIARNGVLTLLRAADGAVLATYSVGTAVRHPSWSPDETKLAFSRAEAGGRRSIHVMDLATGTVTPFRTGATETFEYPAWSPDGGYIAYARRPDGGRFDLWYARADGTGDATALTSDQAVDDAHPDWILQVRTPVPPPVAVITAPANGSVFDEGSAITFSGSATDHTGAPITGDALVWTSSRDGELGRGASITRSLSVGDHVIRLAATDADGRTGTTTVGIIMEPSGPVKWVAAGDGGGAIMTSTEGTYWRTRSSPLGRARGVGRSSDLWIVTGDVTATNANTNLVTSTDGVTWTARTTPFNNTVYVARWNGEMWLAGAAARSGSPTLAMSMDGITWTTAGVEPFTIATLDIGWNGSMWVAVGAGGAGTGTTIARSPDGISWVASQSPFGTSTTINTAGWGVAWNGDMWVAVGSGATAVATSTDGETWTARSSPMTTGYGIAWNGALWVAVGTGGGTTIMTSPDGVTWTARTSPFTTARGIAWDGKEWVATGTGTATMATSPDGITWTARSAPLTNGWGVASVQPIVPPSSSLPVVSITSPADGAVLDQGADVILAGSAVDALGTPITGESLSWTSSRDGVLGTGNALLVSTLTVGEHTITLRATDAVGRVGSAQVRITIEPTDPAVLTSIVVSPSLATVSGLGTAQFAATALDQFQRVMPGIDFTWSSSNRCIAAVDPNGFARAIAAPGNAAIRASAGNVTGSGTFRVQLPQAAPPDSLAGDWIVCDINNGTYYMTLHLVHETGSQTVTGRVTMADGQNRILSNGQWRDNVFSVNWTLLVQGGERTFGIVGATAINENVMQGQYNNRYTLSTHDVHLVRLPPQD